MNNHAESLDTKAGVVLGFAGVLVGLGATAQSIVPDKAVFQVGLGVAVLSATLAAWAFLPRRYPVLDVYRLRQNYLTASPGVTQLYLLDTQIEMVKEAAELVKHKGRRVKSSVGCLAISAGLVVAGNTDATGGVHNGHENTPPGSGNSAGYPSSTKTRSSTLPARQGPHRIRRERPEAACTTTDCPHRKAMSNPGALHTDPASSKRGETTSR